MIFPTLCLALTIYHEARNQPIEGQIMVAEVVINRVHDAAYPDSICAVVAQPHQFAWVGRVGPIAEPDAWAHARTMAAAVLEDPEGTLPGTGATHFHEISARPSWAARLTRVRRVGDHVFYASTEPAGGN
jgi:N-acetylmuramoyl-L-alanine amidase